MTISRPNSQQRQPDGAAPAPEYAAGPEPARPGLYGRFKAAAKALKRQVLALYYALQDPRTGVLPRLLGALALAYALSPMDLIPDFIPILGLVDDLLLLPGLIWLAVRLIPADVWEDSRQRAEHEPLRLSSNWGMAFAIFLLWDALLLWLVYLGWGKFGPERLRHAEARWWVVGGCGAALVLGELAWSLWQLRRERRRRGAAAAPGALAAAAKEGGDLEEGLLSGQQPQG